MLGVAIIGSLVTGGFLLLARGIPREAPLSYARRLRALTNPRILAILLSTVGTVTAANAVYVYIGPIVAVSGEQLAIVLLVYGLAGLAGNALGGFLTDRFGTVAVVAILGGMQILAIATLSTRGSLVMFVVVFAVIGVAGGAQQPAVQHRMVTIDPALAATVLAWNSTALYAGLALAPLVGGLAIEWAGPVAVPLAAVAVLILALGVFLLAYVLPARPASTAGSESNPSPRSTTSMTAR
jgi:DHA1 family inner membrane transport protein